MSTCNTPSYPGPEDVRYIITTSLDESALQSYIDDAALMASPCIFNYTPDRQRAIIKWLTAHLLSSSPNNGSGSGGQTLASQRLGDASETYVNPAPSSLEGLASTSYGRMAMSFDTNGCLMAVGQKPAIFQVL